jgi:hypothetical protein
MGTRRKKEGSMADHTVNIFVTGAGQLKCVPLHVKVKWRDSITWLLHKKYAFGIMVKSPFTPLEKHLYLSPLKPRTPNKIKARVLNYAPPGHYPYGVGAFDGRKLLVEDPEIIVRPPGGGRP